jgi:CRP-like cAMP-binding protein
MKTMPSNRELKGGVTILRTSLGRLTLPPDLVEELIERHIAVAFQKGALAFSEGKIDCMLACILSGYVNVYCPVGDGNRTVVRLAGPGEVIGYPDYVDEKGRHASIFEAQVVSECTMALFSRDHVAQLLARLPPDALLSILASLNTFWSENLRHFTVLLNLPLWDRLTIVMSDLGNRVGVKDSDGIVLLPELGQQDLSEMIGCSRGMVSRMIGEMVEFGLLARRGKQYVLLKKWKFIDNRRQPQKAVRQVESTASTRLSTSAVSARSRNESASKAVGARTAAFGG